MNRKFKSLYSTVPTFIAFSLFLILGFFVIAQAQGGDGGFVQVQGADGKVKNIKLPSKLEVKKKIARQKVNYIATVKRNKTNSKVKNFEYYIGNGVELWYDKAELQKAIESFNRAIALAPKNSQGYLWRGRAYAFAEIDDEAEKDFTLAIELKPSDSVLWYARGEFYRERESWDKALNDFNKSILLSPDGLGFQKRAAVYKQKGNLDAALKDINKAVADTKEMKEALENSSDGEEYAEEFAFDYYQVLTERAEINYLKKQYAAALIDVNEVIKTEYLLPDAYRIRALIYKAQGKKELAKADLEKFEELKAEAEAGEEKQ